MLNSNGKTFVAKQSYEKLKELASNEKLWLAVGRGNESWDVNGTPNPSGSESTLQSEIIRVKVLPDDIVFVQPNNNNNSDDDIISDIETNTIRILGNVSYPFEAFREYGLFINGSEDRNSGTLIAYDTHDKIILGQLNLYMKYIYLKF